MPNAFRRFTSGSVGELSFDILNDLFARVEALETQSGTAASRSTGDDGLILARLGVPGINNRYAWQEVSCGPTNLAFPNLIGGINSGPPPNDIYTREAVAIDAAVYEVGDIVLLQPLRKTDGTDYYAIVRPAGSRVRAYVIVSFSLIQSSPPGSLRWEYTVARATVDYNQQSGELQWSFSDNQTVAMNGAENAVDLLGVIGAGTRLPDGATAVRQPIPTGTVVLCSDTAGNTLVFSMPNGYLVNCGN